MRNNYTQINFIKEFDGSFFCDNSVHSIYNSKCLYQDTNTLEWSYKKTNNNSCEYLINLDGFRCNDFKIENPDFLFAGCSETYGSGGPIEDTWAYMVYKKNNFKGSYVNLGLPGSGWKESIYNIFVYIEKYGIPKNIFLLLPNIERKIAFDYPIKIVNKNKKKSKLKVVYDKTKEKKYIQLWWVPIIGSNNIEYPKKYKIDVDEYKTIFLERYQDLSILSKICKILKINLIWSSWFDNENEMFSNINKLYKDQFTGFVDLDFNFYLEKYLLQAKINNDPESLDKYDGHHPIVWHKYISDVMYNKFLELEKQC